jgi:membrane-bound metal-dependent hydrolase YbcI (DUF457 family)
MLNTAGFAPGILSFVIPKLGVVALLIRLFNPSRPRKIFLWSFVGGSCIIISGCIVIIYAQCSPTRALWTLDLNGARCWSPWILVDYSLFAGGKWISAKVVPILTLGSTVGFLRPILGNIPRCHHVEAANRTGKEDWIDCGFLSWCLVSTVWYLASTTNRKPSAAVVAVYKCTRIPGLADESDSTCKNSIKHPRRC